MIVLKVEHGIVSAIEDDGKCLRPEIASGLIGSSITFAGTLLVGRNWIPAFSSSLNHGAALTIYLGFYRTR